MGLICAVLALVAIFFGKYVSMKMLIEKEAEKISAQMVTRQEYEDYLNEARAYHRVNTDEQLRAFMIDYEYTDSRSPEMITQEEMDTFREESAPQLHETVQNPPGYEEWKAEKEAMFNSFMAIMGEDMVMDAVIENLGLWDILFVLLGIGTAFKVGAMGFEESAA
jgi:hypothetical protein